MPLLMTGRFSFRPRVVLQLFSHKAALFLLLSIVLFTKSYILFFTDFGSERLVLDEYTNLDYANSIKNSFSYWSQDGMAYRPPVYSMLLVLIKVFVGNKIIYYKIANILLSLGTIILVYSSLEKRKILAACYVACYPPFFFLYELVLAENLAIFWVALLIKLYTLLLGTKDKRLILAFGCVSGLLALTRPESIPFMLLAHMVLILRESRMAISFLCMIVVVHCWLLRNYLLFQRYPLISTNAANTFYLATFPESTGTSIYSNDDIRRYPTFGKDLEIMNKMTEIERYDYYRTMGWQYLKDDPSVFLRLLPVRVGTLLVPENTVALRLIRADRFHLSERPFVLFVWLASLWEAMVWIGLVYLIIRRRIDLFYVSFLFGLIITVFFVIAEARYKMQIMPSLVVAIISAFSRSGNKERYKP